MAKVRVKHAIIKMEKALAALKELPENMVVQGNFDQGGYADCSWELTKFNIVINPITQEIIEEDYDPEDPDSPTPYVEITANFV